MIKIKFYDDMSDRSYLYVVIITRYKDKWVFCRQKNKDTWEVPGGHVEDGEHVNDAAERELCEETGALEYKIMPICDFSVSFQDGDAGFSRLYYAEILELGKLNYDYEIEELAFMDEMPEKLTYPIIQPVLFDKAKKEIEKNKF